MKFSLRSHLPHSCSFCVAVLGILSAASAIRADDIYVWAEEVGGNVVVFHQGSIDITGFPAPSDGESFPAIQPSTGVFVLGVTAVDVFSNVLAPGASRAFGPGDVAAGTSASPLPFGVDETTRLALPAGYSSGTPIAGSTTFEGADFESLGIDTTPFTFQTTVGSNTIHMFTVPPPSVDNSVAIAALKKKIRKLQKKVQKLRKKGKKAKAKRLSKKAARLKKQLAALG